MERFSPPYVVAALTFPGVVSVLEASPERSFGLEVKKQSAAQTHTSPSLSRTVCLSPALPQPLCNQISCTPLHPECVPEESAVGL